MCWTLYVVLQCLVINIWKEITKTKDDTVTGSPDKNDANLQQQKKITRHLDASNTQINK